MSVGLKKGSRNWYTLSWQNYTSFPNYSGKKLCGWQKGEFKAAYK